MKKLLMVALVCTAAVSQAQKKILAFKDGDRVAFVGNSITENGFYELYVWQYYQLHFPSRKITVFNEGIGGDVAGQILSRFDDDVLAKKPTVVAVTFGMNDSHYFEYLNTPAEKVRKEAVGTAYASYLEIEKKLKAAPGITKILMASSPYDETVKGPKNIFPGKYKTMIEIAQFQEDAAKKNNWGFVDLMRPMTSINEREQKRDTGFTITGPDRIHPGNAGHFVMAWLFLKAQGLANTVVADVNINAKTGKLVKAANASVSAIKATASKLVFDYKANSLPYPVDSSARVWENPQKQSDALAVIPFTDEFNKELFKVTGLKGSGKYALSIDGTKIGEWTGASFANGINLAVEHSTPQYKQAQQVADLNLQHRDLEQKLRAYYWLQYNYFHKKNMYLQDDVAALDSVNLQAGKDWAVASKKDNYKDARIKENRDQWQAEMDAITTKIYTVNQPAKHTVTIDLVK